MHSSRMRTARFGSHCEQNDWLTGVKTLPCPKLRLLTVKKIVPTILACENYSFFRDECHYLQTTYSNHCKITWYQYVRPHPSGGFRIFQTQWGRGMRQPIILAILSRKLQEIENKFDRKGRMRPLGSANASETVSLSLQNNMESLCEIPIRNSIRTHSVKNNLRNTDQKELRRKLIKAWRLRGNWWTSHLRENWGIRDNLKGFIGGERCEPAAWISPWWFTRVRRAPTTERCDTPRTSRTERHDALNTRRQT